MSSFLTALISTIMLVIATPVLAQEVSGQYRIEGANPDGKGTYRGQVAVTKTGETYQVTWVIGTSKHIGTGLQQDGVFSVIYQPDGASAGIAVYKIGADGVLIGSWTNLGGKVLGSETWTPDKGI
jgi:hypothetical protein